ncbi:leucine-rich PPR motif-containing protein, mitochondrial [Seriola aureovittata]|uniref:leucine-rich PPR motif-containing protein, mitochondrial n=1 Tax=Seriola aureovittata TaxID=2871759 RepID=UPI0024BD95E9|nr:leucine-rich PPR motif-containing protein, mitochondrial [Seriola aureovittata]
MPFHASTANMAALLRSARLLKFSPSGLLQIAGTNRTGPPLSRLYSGALGSRRTGGCSRLMSPAASSSRVWPYAVGCARSYAVATDKKDEAGVAVRSKQAQQFDWALTKLDNSVRRTGRITKTLLLHIFHDICRTGYPSGNQALLLLRSCGYLLPEVPQEERTVLAHRMWEKLKELGAQFDVSHYNALLKVYLQNDFKFSPTDFLAKMEVTNIQPNRVTYQRLIAAYCQNGDIEGASTILGFMKSKDLPITEAVFNSLVTGHARAGDMESAKNILSVMQGAGIEPGPDTYVSLLTAYAEKGDMDTLKKTIEEAESADCNLMDRDIMQIILTLAKAGHQQHIPQMVERLKQERGYVPDAMNLCLSLITQGQEDTAFTILKNFPTLQPDTVNTDSPNLGNFFLRHCVNMDMAVEKIGHYCKELQDSNLHTSPLVFSLQCALEAKKTGMSLQLMKILKEQGLPIRQHYFWPLLSPNMKNNTAGVLEVMKGMQELGVSPDAETLTTYVVPAFSSIEAAQQAFQDAGVLLQSVAFLSLKVCSLAVCNLAQVYPLLSDPSFTALDLSYFRGSLILGFKKSDDVESMVKITELLYKDERFSNESSNPAEGVSFLLYSLIDNMSEQEVQAQEDKLRKFFNQLKDQNITISLNIYRGIRNLLQSYHIPELIKDVITLVDPKDRMSIGSAVPRATGIGVNVQVLESKLAELKAENKPLGSVLKQVIQALCVEENLQRALEVKQQYEEEVTVSSYTILINQCCHHNNVEEALNLKRELSRKDSSAVLDTNKYITLVRVLSKNDRVEEAVDILKEMKEKEVAITDAHVVMLFHTLNALAAKGDVPVIQQLQDTIFTLGLAKPSANLCSPLITAYLERKDLPGALEAVLECQKRYNHMPRIHDILVALVEKGDTELLQKAMDFISQERGEMNMLYDLCFAFLQSGRYREARKVIETPGLRARPGRLQWYAEKCILANQMEALEQMVDMTAKLFQCDRDEMYSYILRLCKKTNNWEKAEALWTKMQEENIIPKERTLRMLADILKSNGQKVPFEVPETWYEEAATKQQVKASTTPTAAEGVTEYETRLFTLCKKGRAKEALGMLKKFDKTDVSLTPATYDHLIRALLAEGAIEDAMGVKDIAVSHMPNFQLSDIATSLVIISHCKRGQTKDAFQQLKSMLQEDQVPSQLAITRLVQALGSHGDVAGIQEVESMMKGLGTTLNLSSMMFINNTALGHIKNGDVESAVELLESVYTSPDSTNPSMSFVFRKILEDNDDKAIDKLSAMAERLANHFACYRPASDLFIQLLDMDKFEDAKFMLARCNAVAEQKEVLISFLTRKAQSPGQVYKIKSLLSLIPDFAEKEVLYSYLMKCHSLDKDLPSAKALHEQMQKEGIVADELSLKRLAGLYRQAGEPVPFTEPPESFKFYANKLKEKLGKAQTTAEE